MTLPLRKVTVFVVVIALVVIGQIGIITWQYFEHQSRKVQLIEYDQVVNQLQAKISALTVLAGDDKQEQVRLKGELHSASQLLVEHNLQVTELEEIIVVKDIAIATLSESLVLAKHDYNKNLSRQLSKEKSRLKVNEKNLAKQQSVLAQQEANLLTKTGDVTEWEKKKAEFDKLYTASALEAENEKRIDKLMAQFDALRVDLSVVNKCDKDYLYRYNEAASVLNHIRTFIQKYEMKQDYYFYVISNDSSIVAQNRTLCLEN